MDPIFGFTRYWDAIDFLSNGLAVIFFGSLAVLGYAKLNISGNADTAPIFRVVTAVAGLGWLVFMTLDWVLPVKTVLYVANTGDLPYQIHAGGDGFCLPAKSWERLSWRFDPPTKVATAAADGSRSVTDTIGKGTWFINVAPTPLSVDVINYDQEEISQDRILASSAGTFHLQLKGEPYRLYSQLPVDRVSIAPDVEENSTGLPCPGTPPPPAPTLAGAN